MHEYASCEDYSSRSLRIRRSLSSGIMTCCIRRRSRGIRVVAAVGILVKVAEHIVSGEWGETLATSSLRSTHELRRKLFGGRAAQIVAICAIMSWKNGDPTGRLPEEWGSPTTIQKCAPPCHSFRSRKHAAWMNSTPWNSASFSSFPCCWSSASSAISSDR